MHNDHPDLIDLDTGEWYEWVEEPAGGGEPGYASVNDHDFTWPRSALSEDGHRIAVLDELPEDERRRLHQLREGDGLEEEDELEDDSLRA